MSENIVQIDYWGMFALKETRISFKMSLDWKSAGYHNGDFVVVSVPYKKPGNTT